MKQIKIEEATAKQLRDFAELVLGLEIGGRETSQMMRGKIQAAGYSRDTIADVGAPAEGPTTAQVATSSDRRINPETRKPETRIIIMAEDKPGGEDPVQVSVNGRLILIPRGEACWVEDPYVEVLRNAVEYVYDQYTGEDVGRSGVDLGGLKKPREVLSYPFQTVSA